MHTPQQTTSFRVAFSRLTWIILGPLAAIVSGIGLFMRGPGLWSAGDALFFAALTAMLLGRWAEFRSGEALSATGEPVTWPEVRRYLFGVVALGLAVWALALLLRLLH
jgi:hypothetical protein